MNIKNLKPNPRSRFRQGYFDVSNSTKYVGATPVIYRSSLEVKCFSVFERSASVVAWSSEPDFVNINYTYNNKVYKYNVDCYVEFANGAKQIIEIKPESQVYEPSPTKFRDKARYHQAVELYHRNMAKWKAAHAWAIANGMTFKILTDTSINKFL